MLFEPKLMLIISFILWASEFKESNGHGRLIEPPSRASMWRYGFNTPPDYNDHELYCGGFTRQYQTNGGKCGICGDPWDAPQPRPHEAGGKYGLGVIARRYKTGQPVIVRVELTANHRGYFEFRLCPNNAPKQVATQSCLDKHVLQRVRTAAAAASTAAGKDAADDAFHETRFYPGPENRVYEMRYALPDGLTCSQCVLQWKYVAGNNWGVCANGTGAVGCGPQEEFRACADVSVSDKDGAADASPYPTEPTPAVTTAAAAPTTAVRDDDDADDTSNEIPGAGERARPSGASVAVFVASVVLLSLGFVAVVFALVYWYYYRAGDTVKSWWRTVTDSSTYACVVRKGNKTAAAAAKTEHPVPPPRVKKMSVPTATIGFKGVPDNLV